MNYTTTKTLKYTSKLQILQTNFNRLTWNINELKHKFVGLLTCWSETWQEKEPIERSSGLGRIISPTPASCGS